MGEQETPEWMGSPAAAAYLGIKLRTLYKVINDGRLPAYKPARVFRVKRADLDAFLEATRIQPGSLDHLCGPDVGPVDPQDDGD